MTATAFPVRRSIVQEWWFRLIVRAILALLAMWALTFAVDRYEAFLRGLRFAFSHDTALWLAWLGPAFAAGLLFGLAAGPPFAKVRYLWSRLLLAILAVVVQAVARPAASGTPYLVVVANRTLNRLSMLVMSVTVVSDCPRRIPELFRTEREPPSQSAPNGTVASTRQEWNAAPVQAARGVGHGLPSVQVGEAGKGRSFEPLQDGRRHLSWRPGR